MTEMIELEMPTLKKVLEEAGGNEKLLKEQSHKLRLWLKQQLHLPQDISDQRLRSFICNSKFNVEKVKKRLDTYYTIRNLLPEMSNLNPLSDNMIQCYKYVQMMVMPKLTPQNYRVYVGRILNPDSSLFDVNTVVKYFILILEILAEEDIVTSDCIIMDMANFHYGHALKYTPSLLKRLSIYLILNYFLHYTIVYESYGRKIKAIHLINAPTFVDWFMSIVKSVMNAKIFSRIHVYTSEIESLYKMVPKSILPADYGGKQPSLDTIAEMWRTKLAAQREWFLEQEKVFTNESLRSNSIINPDDLFGVSGTFQKLDID